MTLTMEMVERFVSILTFIVGVYLTLTSGHKNRADADKSKAEAKKIGVESEKTMLDLANGNVELAILLKDAAASMIKPLNDRIDDLEEINKQKDLEIKRLGSRITDLEKQVKDLKKENDALKNCGE